MTIVDRRPTTPEAVLAAARQLAPVIAARASEIEAGRRIPPDLQAQLVEAGCFRMLLPRSHGGAGADVAGALQLIEVLAGADASVGWNVATSGAGWVDLAGLPRTTFDALFRGPDDVIVAGAFNPSGEIAATAGGYRVNGRWAFASGCEHAHWLYANCIEGVVDGRPQMRMAVLARSEVTIEDTWTVSGLCGTGSHHFHVRDVEVPADRTFVPLSGTHCLDEAVVRFPVPSLFALGIAAVALGTARAALDDILALAAGKVPLLSQSALATNPRFQFQLAQADAGLRAARALVFEAAGSGWATAVAGRPFSLEQTAHLRAAAVWATTTATEVVDTAHRAGGGSSVYTTSPLQRRHRDVHAITQHFLVKEDNLTTAGAILAGQGLTMPVF